MDEELVLLYQRDVSYWLLDVGISPARPAERFARRMPITLPQASLAAHRFPPTNNPRVHPAYPGRPRGRTGHCPTTSHDDARSKPTPPLAQHRLRQLRDEAPNSGRRRAGHGRSGRPRRPRPSQPYGYLPHHRAPGPHLGRTQWTRQRTNTGRRHRTWTADTWTLRRPHRTLDTGPVDRQAWTLVARTGHRTPDTEHRTLAEDATG
jgi:hypothetical protein